MIDLKGKHVMIVGAGRTVVDYKDEILKYISDNDITTIGINLMTSFCIPDYHLWTNRQRYGTQYSCISDKSKLMFGENISDELVRRHWKGDFERINYKNESILPISYKDGIIYGNFRTAGILAIMIAHVKGASKIDIVGMDGFTFYSKKELDNKEKSHHCYGSGYTDDADWEKCLGKDKMVDDGLHSMEDYGVNFRILTPTIFRDFYCQGVI